MSQAQHRYDWAAARGDKWAANLSPMEAMLLPVNKALFTALSLEKISSITPRVADLGCGGGGTTIALHQLLPTPSVVHGFDISTSLIEAARQRVHEQGPSFEVTNVETALAPTQGYDRLTSRFGVMFFQEPLKAFRHLREWLVPHGRFAFAVWGPLAANPWVTTVRDVVAEFVDIPSSAADTPGPFRYADIDAFLELLKKAGLVDLATRPWQDMLAMGGGMNAEDASHFALTSFSSFGEMLCDAGERAQREAHQRLTQRFEAHQHDGIVEMEAYVHIVTGSRT